MNVITIVIWMAIIIVAIIAIISVKKHYNSEELENDDDVLFSDSKSINKIEMLDDKETFKKLDK